MFKSLSKFIVFLSISFLLIDLAQADSIKFIYKNNHNQSTQPIVPTMMCGNFSYPFEGRRELDFRKQINQAEYIAKPAGLVWAVRNLSWTCSVGALSLRSAGGESYYYNPTDLTILYPNDFDFSKTESTVEFTLEKVTEDFSHCHLGYGGYRTIKYEYSLLVDNKKYYHDEVKDTVICDGPP